MTTVNRLMLAAFLVSLFNLPTSNASTRCLLFLSQLENQEFKSCVFSMGGTQRPVTTAKITAIDLTYKVELVDATGTIELLDLFKITEDANGNNQSVDGLKTEFVVCSENTLIYQIKTPDHIKHAVGTIKLAGIDKALEVNIIDKSFRKTSLVCSQ